VVRKWILGKGQLWLNPTKKMLVHEKDVGKRGGRETHDIKNEGT